MPVINPLVDDLSGLKDAEVETKIADLSKKYWLTRNPDIQYQISCFIQIYKDEMAMRRAKAWEQQNQKRNKDLDNLIQVN
jgi:hypothetical protein